MELKTNSTMQTLNLDGNDISEEGARALAEALETNSTLETLDLGTFNNIESSSVRIHIEHLLSEE